MNTQPEFRMSHPQHRLSPGGDRRGFTLIELILVMAMLLIVLSVSAPSLSRFFRGRTLDSEARRFLALTHYGQSRAISEGIPMRLWIDIENRRYGLEAEEGFVEEDEKATEFELDRDIDIEIEESTVPVRESLFRQTAAQSETGNEHRIHFTPDGFIDISSPETVLFLEKERAGEDATTRNGIQIGQSRNRLHYEIQTNWLQTARR
ncbi:MAG TPA: prepilin-type N-terminal cleavage/methylation domain-containing protein [Candidatus Paceibacterota bacterium]|nr:prepilin-type N-terminal cleavage/methylation domain-containing protein [Verrucomicrobiota bacterium]HRY46832.1 prepilin-type N-terminal cleavage/methylation domain-containing protein [Candidatus Paceibacterota bacterium]HSA01617.1 prepilin-type N-terminal cleavage/methylation domain-containing protein [Candidatus Paceibacterota bacterium]